jgi:hypothetical protein
LSGKEKLKGGDLCWQSEGKKRGEREERRFPLFPQPAPSSASFLSSLLLSSIQGIYVYYIAAILFCHYFLKLSKVSPRLTL